MAETSWSVQRSIVLELGAAVYYLSQRHLHLDFAEAYKPIFEATPAEWLTELEQMNPFGAKIDSVLEILGIISNSLLGDDYSQATLRMRQLTREQVQDALALQLKAMEIESVSDVSSPDKLINQAIAIHRQSYARLGLISSGLLETQHAKDFQLVLQILSGQSTHDSFWHWMDRFCYQAYLPWREKRLPLLDNRQQQAEIALKTSGDTQGFPSLEWLDAKNVLNRIPELRQAVTNQNIELIFWVEPFGLADTWVFAPGRILVSFAQPGEIFEQFTAYNQQLAAKISALSDPTRLIILRIIRHFGMTNTGMADFLGIARPTVSIHAKILREAGFIESTQDGRITKHVIKPEAIRQLLREIESFIDLSAE